MNAAILLLASSMCGETFTVTNRMPAFHVRNLMPPTITKAPCNLCDNCQCTACNCPDLTKKPAFVPKTKLYVFSTRAARGHTHTCANGHTWDHAANPTHQCQFCGQNQYVQDRSPRPVTIRTVATDATLRPSTAAYAAPQTTSFYSLPRASAGCANGSCATISFR